MYRFSTGLALTLGFCTLSANPGLAQSAAHCGTRDAVVSKLNEKYGETRQSLGLGGNNTLVELFASPETGSWTITITTPGGKTCLMASGQAFETLREPLKKGEDA
ncbi:MAG: hypothetical protein OIF40_13900 [Mangrovicoccus sp.]|nr:hypothetical protein [Mangrovicoccus sp.]